jgi:hypothetical protein
MSESMRERIARALEARFDELGLGCDWLDYADAALATLRELTQPMIAAGDAAVESQKGNGDEGLAAWDAMLDAASIADD